MIAKAISSKRSGRLIEVLLIASLVLFNTYQAQSATKLNLDNFPGVPEDMASKSDSLEALVNKDILVLQRYGSDRRKWVKKGTLPKVYVLPFSQDAIEPSFHGSFMSGKEVYRGHFQSLVGDTLTIVQFGRERKFDIDDLYQIKVFNDIGARVFGDMLNATSGVGFLYAGAFLAFGVALAADNDPWASFGFYYGAIFAGVSFLVHHLALIIRRNKYDLVSNWYIVRSF